MKTTQYFDYTRRRLDRAGIKEEWIVSAMENPIHEQVQSDGRIRRWTWVKREGRFLRVVLLPDGETVHNAFYDRRFEMKGKE